MSNVLKDKLGNILNPHIPRYEKPIEYITSTNESITFTPKFNCYAEIMCDCATWGNNGGDNRINIVNTVGDAEEIFSFTNIQAGGNTASRPLIARGVWKCKKNISYTFARTLSNSGGEHARCIIVKLVPIP